MTQFNEILTTALKNGVTSYYKSPTSGHVMQTVVYLPGGIEVLIKTKKTGSGILSVATGARCNNGMAYHAISKDFCERPASSAKRATESAVKFQHNSLNVVDIVIRAMAHYGI